MNNILLILVGGTICTAVNQNGNLSVDKNAGVRLKENFINSDSEYAGKVDIDLTENMLILSENMTVDKWNLLIELYRRHISEKKYDGVIFAHGTDSLAYSSCLFSFLLADTEIPVFFVSSNKRLEADHSNGNLNFRYAVECICRGISPNVYVVYKNISDNIMYLHLASRLMQCQNYSEDFYSVGAIDITDISRENYKDYFSIIDRNFPADKKKPLVSIKKRFKLKDNVLIINPYVGLRYDAFNYKKFRAILHGTYHSGTACVENDQNCDKYSRSSLLSMIDTFIDKSIPADIYLSPAKISTEMYQSVPIIKDHRKDQSQVVFLYGATQTATYAKLLIAYSLYKDKKQIQNFIKTQINFEIIYE